jgi:hypothetical protein
LTRILARAACAGLVAGFVSASAIAQTPPAATASPPSKAEDRNEKVCQKIEVTGSRLATRRVCKTRAEWADLQLQDRQEIERIQVQRGMRSD